MQSVHERKVGEEMVDIRSHKDLSTDSSLPVGRSDRLAERSVSNRRNPLCISFIGPDIPRTVTLTAGGSTNGWDQPDQGVLVPA